MTTKKRQRKRQVYVCQKCGSPFSWAHTNQEYRTKTVQPKMQPINNGVVLATPVLVIQPVRTVGHSNPSNFDYFVERKCLSCGDKHREDVAGTNLINNAYEQILDAHYVEMKSPFEVELKFESIKIDKKTMKKAANNQCISQHGMPAFFAFCQDRNGLLYRFGGKSAMEVIYHTVKGRWFTTRICIQKFVRTNKNAKRWTGGIGSEDTIQHWRQSPRIVDDIVLL